QAVFDRELSQLPDKYRAVIVLCELERKSRRQAARELDLPEGTVGSRLARAKRLLAKRLARHGLPLAGGALAAVLSQAAAASMPAVGTQIGRTGRAIALPEGDVKRLAPHKLQPV